MNGNKKVIDFYLINSKGRREYAFTRRYTKKVYDLVKGGIPIKRLLQTRTKDQTTMKLVNYTSIMMPYFMDEIEWMAA